MATPDWPLFAAAVAALTAAILWLSRASARLVGNEGATAEAADGAPSAGEAGRPAQPAFPTGGALLANVAVTHGTLVLAVVGLAWYAGVPPDAFGVRVPSTAALALGLGLGVGLYLASEAATSVAARAGVEPDERLRELLAPADRSGWVLLLGGVLPVVAVAEELLFRGVLVGALGAGFDLPAWTLVFGSSVLFGLGHSAQRGLGVVVTAALGLALGVAFVLTGSLAVVVLAHYVVDVLEFGVREAVLD